MKRCGRLFREGSERPLLGNNISATFCMMRSQSQKQSGKEQHNSRGHAAKQPGVFLEPKITRVTGAWDARDMA